MNLIPFICEFLKAADISSLIWRYYINEFKSGFNMPASHFHKAIEVIYVLDGFGFMKFDNDVVKVAKNNCLIILSEKPHQFYVENNCSCTLVNIHFNFNDIEDNLLFFNSDVFNRNGYLKLSDYTQLQETMKKIVFEMDNRQDNYEILVKMHVCELFILLSRIVEKNRHQSNEPAKQHVSDAIHFIQSSLAQDLSPEIISRAIHISPDYLLHIFKDYTGNSLMKYVAVKRIEESKELLKKTDRKITDIASQVGIPNSQYFSTLFKKYTDMSPNQYRKISQMTNNSDSNIFK